MYIVELAVCWFMETCQLVGKIQGFKEPSKRPCFRKHSQRADPLRTECSAHRSTYNQLGWMASRLEAFWGCSCFSCRLQERYRHGFELWRRVAKHNWLIENIAHSTRAVGTTKRRRDLNLIYLTWTWHCLPSCRSREIDWWEIDSKGVGLYGWSDCVTISSIYERGITRGVRI